MSYVKVIPVEFNHCDPAGIVFYPRYFEMTNSVVENFFADVLDYSFARLSMIEKRGVPTVRIRADFTAPSRLGDRVTFALSVLRIGRSSVTFRVLGTSGSERRLVAELTLVWIERDGRPAPWPEALRARLVTHLDPTTDIHLEGDRA